MIAEERLLIDLEAYRNNLAVLNEVESFEVRRLLHIIHDHLFDSELNVCSLREWSSMRNHNISSLFKRETGIAIRDYVERHRMEAAAHVLSVPHDVSIFTIACEIGYTSPEAFSRTFKRHFGNTPSRYRESALQHKRAAA